MIVLTLLAVTLFLLDDITTYKILKDYPHCIREEQNGETRKLFKKYGAKGIFYGWRIIIFNIMLFVSLVITTWIFFNQSISNALTVSFLGFYIIKMYAVLNNIFYYKKQRVI